jgi:hypothetical protein
MQLSGRNATLVYSSSIAEAAANATGDAPAEAPPPPGRRDPAPFAYPPAGDLPTVFFTAQLPGLGGAGGFTPEARAAFDQALLGFLAPAGGGGGDGSGGGDGAGAGALGGAVAEVSVLAVQEAAAGLWVPAAVRMRRDPDGSLRGLLVSTLQVGDRLSAPIPAPRRGAPPALLGSRGGSPRHIPRSAKRPARPNARWLPAPVGRQLHLPLGGLGRRARRRGAGGAAGQPCGAVVFLGRGGVHRVQRDLRRRVAGGRAAGR